MDDKTKGILEEVQKLFDCANQSWLFGAGISFESNIPLMYPLTERVEQLIQKSKKKEIIKMYSSIKKQLRSEAHIEHYLSQIGDLIVLIERSGKSCIKVNTVEFSIDTLKELYGEIINYIGETVRYGYSNFNGEEKIGSISNPIVDIENHRKFVRAIKQISKEKITKYNFFTTNYDTLLEDALALEHQDIVDGFLGGAIGFWNPTKAYEMAQEKRAHKIFKLHGSTDWYMGANKELIRCRYGTKYLSDNHNLLIYPQSTKYVETQKDPFAYLFTQFRDSFNQNGNNVFIVNGYSFGDNHINNEIEDALHKTENKTTVIIFIKETYISDTNEYVLPAILSNWITDDKINERVYILTNRGVYNGTEHAFLNAPEVDYTWWTFNGMIDEVMLGGI